MKNFKNLLLFHPFSKETLEQATSMMTNSQARLTLFKVAPELESNAVIDSDGKKVDLQKLLVADYQCELEALAAPLKNEGLRVSVKVVTGKPFLEIVRQVISKKHDLVLMTADGVGGVREQLFGTTSQHVMRKCPCPVWVMKPSRRKKLRNVLAAVDPDSDDQTRNQLNQLILQHAESIAINHSARLHVVHAWTTFGGEVTRGRRWMKASEIRLYVEKVASEHRDLLNQSMSDHLTVQPIVHLIQGKAGEVIPRIADEQNVDLLVMGTVCRSGIPGFFIGNTAEMVLSQVDCSVLTLKPLDFVTPVRLI